MDNTTNNETGTTQVSLDEAVNAFIKQMTATEMAENLVKRDAEIDRLDDERRRLNRSVKADDWRALELLKEMHDVMVNNSCAHLWQNFVDEIDGMPNLNRRTYSGTVTLKFHFSDVEIAGDLADWEVEEAILDAIDGDLGYGYEDEREVDYTED